MKVARTKMKKIVITLRDITENGGGERVCANLANAFLEYFGTTHDLNILDSNDFLLCKESNDRESVDSSHHTEYMDSVLSKESSYNSTIHSQANLSDSCNTLIHNTQVKQDLSLDSSSHPSYMSKNLIEHEIGTKTQAKNSHDTPPTFSQTNGYEIEILSFYHQHEKPFYNIHPNIKITFLSKATMSHSNKFKRLFFKTMYRFYLIFKAIRYISKAKPEIVLANDGTFMPLCKLKGVRYLRLWHIKTPHKSKRIFQFFDSIVILSAKNLPIWQNYHYNISVIPNFLPHIPYKATNHKQKRILALGRMSWEKGFSRLIDSYNLIARDFPDWELVIAGDGALRHELESQIEFLDLGQYVKLLPFTKDTQSLYLSSSIYVMSSIFEGFPMVLLEASSYALPLIAFDIATGPSDIIQDNVSGFLIHDGDCKDFAYKLRLLMQDENMRENMGYNAKEFIKSHFSKEAILPLWQKVLFE